MLELPLAELCIVSALGAEHSFVKSETGIPSLPTWHPLFTINRRRELVGVLAQDNPVLSHLPVFFGVPGRNSRCYRPVASLKLCGAVDAGPILTQLEKAGKSVQDP